MRRRRIRVASGESLCRTPLAPLPGSPSSGPGTMRVTRTWVVDTMLSSPTVHGQVHKQMAVDKRAFRDASSINSKIKALAATREV